MSCGIASAGSMRSFEAKPPTTPSKRRLNNFAVALIHRIELKARKGRGRPLLGTRLVSQQVAEAFPLSGLRDGVVRMQGTAAKRT